MGVKLLRPGLLDGVGLLVVASYQAGTDSYGRAVHDASRLLGADARMRASDATVTEGFEESVTEQIDVLVVDGASLFTVGGLQRCLACAWEATRTVVNGAFLPGAGGSGASGGVGQDIGREGRGSIEQRHPGGRIVYLAPPPASGTGADAARAGLENLTRTLSIEWARHDITVVSIALGDSTGPGEAAALAAYLASPAGAYFSGCQLDLRGP